MSNDSRNARSGSAFTRLAGIVPSALSGSSTSSGSHVSASSIGSLPAPAASGRAFDALEALASADGTRPRQSITPDLSAAAYGSNAAQRRADKSRSRDRADSPALMVQSRMIGAGRDSTEGASNSGYWAGGESGSTNLHGSSFSLFHPNSSSISAFAENGSHFFPAGASAFSFEGDPDNSWRLGSASPSLFGANRHPNSVVEPSTSYAGPSSWDLTSASAGRFRGESLTGGGKKPKDQSRGLRYAVSAPARERGLTGLAKPREGDLGRVAVAGKTCLKILKVPRGGPRRGREMPHASPTRSTSIAYRRSRSRGVALDGDNGFDSRNEREEVCEVLDVRAGSKLGPSYLFSDVRWGYDATSNKLATSFTNGAVSLWDLGSGTARVTNQVKYEHDRAVNRVCFGGASGSWLMSGGQDGQMKLWDIREARPASLVLKASSPVRHLAFSPSSAQPFTLLAACASGTLIRYDLRYTSRQGGGATDRIAGHVGSCLAMDWRDSLGDERVDTAGGAREGGWVVTGGLDKTIKIWDFSLSTLSTKPTRTLYSSQPVQIVAWHPTRATEIASSPLPALAADGPEDGAAPPTPSRETWKDIGTGTLWKNELEIWDVRRPSFPKYAIKTDEPMSAIVYNDDDTLWSTSKSTTTFLQHDLASDSYSLLDSIERPSAPWSFAGDMVFVDDPRQARRKPFETPSHSHTPDNGTVDSPVIRPDVNLNSLTTFDPDFSASTFAYLAKNLLVEDSDFSNICDTNAEVYAYADRPDATQFWLTLKVWLSEAVFDFDLESPPSPEAAVDVAPTDELPRFSLRHDHSARLSGTGTPSSDARVVPFSRITNNPAHWATHSPRLLPSDGKIPLADFSEMSMSSEKEDVDDDSPPLVSGYSYYPELSSSSDSDSLAPKPPPSQPRKLSSSTNPAVSHATKLASSLANLRTSSRRPSRGSVQGRDGAQSYLDALRSEATAAQIDSPLAQTTNGDVSSESASESEGDAGEKVQRARAIKKQASAGQSSAVRKSGSRGEDQRRQVGSRDSRRSGQASQDDFNAVGRASTSNGLSVRRPSKELPVVNAINSSEGLARAASAQYAQAATEAVKSQIQSLLQEYADQGDSQLCATVCCVLQHHGIKLQPLFVTRVTKAYLDLLRRSKLHVPAAAINKACASTQLRSLTENNVVHHAACGRCGKAIEHPPFGYCTRCSSQATRCCVCHRNVRSMYMWCPACGHGAHPACVAALYTTLSPGSARASISAESPVINISHPSTPGIATPLRNWMWGEDSLEEAEEAAGDSRSRLDRRALSGCPAGLCGHSPCLLAGSLE